MGTVAGPAAALGQATDQPRSCCGRGRPGPSDGAAVGAAVGTAACPEPSVGEAVGAGAGAASLGRSSDQPKKVLVVVAVIAVVMVVVQTEWSWW